jgi:VWFA-related protein
MKRLLAGLCAISLSVGPILAQDPPKADSTADDPIFRTKATFVLVPVSVVDRDGSFVNGLTPYDFRLYDNGKGQIITEDLASHPISLVVVVQANASVEKILPQVQKIGSVIDSLVTGENGEAAVIGFDHRIQTLTDFTSDPDKLTAAFKKLKPGSTTSRLNDAAMEGINMLRRRPATQRRVMLLVSEARDYGSEGNVRDVMTAAEFGNVIIYSVNMSRVLASLTSKAQPPRPNAIPAEARHLPAGITGTSTTDAQMDVGNWTPVFTEIFRDVKGIFVPNPLAVYTKYSGGREYSFLTQQTLERAVSDIGEELHSQYLLTYSPNDQDEAGFHEILVQVQKPDMKIRTRNGYWLAGRPQ